MKYKLRKKLLFSKSVQRHSKLLQLASRNEEQFLFHVSNNTLVKDIKSPDLWEFVHCIARTRCSLPHPVHLYCSDKSRLKKVVQKPLCFFVKSTVLDSILYYFVQQMLWTLCSLRSFNVCRKWLYFHWGNNIAVVYWRRES